MKELENNKELDGFSKEINPEVELPEIELPEIELPEIELPEIELAEIELPEIELAEVELPEIELSGTQEPETHNHAKSGEGHAPSKDAREQIFNNKKVQIIGAIVAALLLLCLVFGGGEKQTDLERFVEKFQNTLEEDSYTIEITHSGETDKYDCTTIDGNKVFGILESEMLYEGYLTDPVWWLIEHNDFDSSKILEAADKMDDMEIYYGLLNNSISPITGTLEEESPQDFFNPMNGRWISSRYFLPGLVEAVKAYEKNDSKVDFIQSYKVADKTIRLRVDLIEYLYWFEMNEINGYQLESGFVRELEDEMGGECLYEINMKIEEDHLVNFTLEAADAYGTGEFLEIIFSDINGDKSDLESYNKSFEDYTNVLLSKLMSLVTVD